MRGKREIKKEKPKSMNLPCDETDGTTEVSFITILRVTV